MTRPLLATIWSLVSRGGLPSTINSRARAMVEKAPSMTLENIASSTSACSVSSAWISSFTTL